MDATQTHTVECADAWMQAKGLPTYSQLLQFAQRMAYPGAGELLILDDYRNIARNLVEPDGRRIAL